MNRKLTDGQVEEICKRYQAGEGAPAIARQYKVSYQAIYDALRSHGTDIRSNSESHLGIKLGKPRRDKGKAMPGRWALDEEQRMQICALYKSGESTFVIARKFNVHPTTIQNILRKFIIPSRSSIESHPGYKRNDQYFNSLTDESAYWLGFISADGCVYHGKHKQSLTIGLAIKDRDHLERFKSSIKSDAPIKDFSNCRYPHCRLTIGSREIISDLARYGIVPRKTFSLRWPQNIPECFLPAFLRGYMDGDGGFYVRTASVYFSLTSNVEFLKGVQGYLMNKCAFRETVIQTNPKGNPEIGTLTYGGRNQVKTLFAMLYKEASVWLPRKKEPIEKYLSETVQHYTLATPSEEALIIQRYQNGESSDQIGQDMKRSGSGIRNILKRSGISRRSNSEAQKLIHFQSKVK